MVDQTTPTTPIVDDPFQAAVDRLLGPPRRPESKERQNEPGRNAFTTNATSIVSRRARRADWSHPFDAHRWTGWEETLETGSIAEIEALAEHPHPGLRRQVASHPSIWRDMREAFVSDEWPEVRASVLENARLEGELIDRLCGDEVPGVSLAARSRRAGLVPAAQLAELRSGDELARLIRQNRCVECGRPIRNTWFQTCSIQCSMEQRERRIKSGFWVDAIAADFRFTTGLRADWPSEFVWPIAVTPASGGVPGTGPRYRATLVSFVRGVRADTIVDFAASVRSAGLDQAQVLDQVAEAALSRAGVELLTETADELGIAWAPAGSPYAEG